ncbi:MAG: DUF2171 domain-containing protein [Actinobacteria bacterium]|nr:MAG: DUF2171 domain-containing protein [Actinomycetota bacterium]
MRCPRARKFDIGSTRGGGRLCLHQGSSLITKQRVFRPVRQTADAMADPVSWLMIETGWKVLAADGSEVGEVDEVAGDSSVDIFDGLAIATNAFGKPRYVPSEQVAEITEGTVRLSLTREQVGRLGEYREPATSAEIEADSKGGIGESLAADARELEGKVLAPTQRHEHSMNIWRRIAFFFRRLIR